MSAFVLAKNTFWGLLSHILSRGSLMLTSILIARSVDVSSFASYAYFQLTVSMLAAYASMGVGIAASRFFAGLNHQNDVNQEGIIAALITISLILAITAFVLVMLVPTYWLSANTAVPKWLMALGVFALTLNIVPAGGILGLEKYRDATLVYFLSAVVLISWTIWAITLKNITLAILGVVVTSLFQTFGETLIIILSLGWRRIMDGFPFQRADVVRILSFAGPMFLISILSGTGAWMIGRIILLGSGGGHAFALFSIGLQWFSLSMVLPGMLSRVMLPRLVAGLNNQTNSGTKHRELKIAMLMATVSTSAMFVLALMLGDLVLGFYGKNYQVGRWLIAAYFLPSIFAANCIVLGNSIIVSEYQWNWLQFSGLWFFILCFIAYLFQDQGVWAGSISYTFAYLAMLLTSFIFARRNGLV